MSVSTVHPAYNAYLPTWVCLREAYAGSGAVKAAGIKYLPRPAGMRKQEQYNAYRYRASWYGATERAVHGLTGSVFRHAPQLDAPAAIEPHLADVTQTGVPLPTFAEQAVRETLLMGRYGILVDFPQLLIGEDGEVAPAASMRPYWIGYQAEEIVNWRTMQRQGDTILSLVVLKECVEQPKGAWGTDDFFAIDVIPQYRVLRLDDQGRYEVSVWVPTAQSLPSTQPQYALRDLWFPTRNGVPLDFIPFVFMAPFSIEPHIEKSLMEVLVEINYRHYRHSADYEHALHLTSLPTPWISGDIDPTTELLIGSLTAWVLPPQSQAGMLEYKGQGLQPHEHAIESDMKDMAALGARLLENTPLVQETAEAVRTRHQGADSPMQSLVTTVSQALTWALQVHAWWANASDDVDDPAVHITLNKDLVSNQLEPQMLTVLMQALLNNTISYETYFYNLQRGEIARPQVTVEDEQALLENQEAHRSLAAFGTQSRRTLRGEEDV